jgi:hypothetical protein
MSMVLSMVTKKYIYIIAQELSVQYLLLNFRMLIQGSTLFVTGFHTGGVILSISFIDFSNLAQFSKGCGSSDTAIPHKLQKKTLKIPKMYNAKELLHHRAAESHLVS